MQKLAVFILFLSVILVSPSFCQQANLAKLPAFHVEAAPEWTNQFKRNNGWFGDLNVLTVGKIVGPPYAITKSDPALG